MLKSAVVACLLASHRRVPLQRRMWDDGIVSPRARSPSQLVHHLKASLFKEPLVPRAS